MINSVPVNNIPGKILTVTLLILMLLSLSFTPVLSAGDPPETTPAFNRIRIELKAANGLTEEEINQIMEKVQTEFRHMQKSGLSQSQMEDIAEQTCRLIQMMNQNNGELKKINQALSFMTKEVENGQNPEEIGNMLRDSMQNRQSLEEAITQTRERIRERIREEKKEAEQKKDKNGKEDMEQEGNKDDKENSTGNAGAGGSNSSNPGGGKK